MKISLIVVALLSTIVLHSQAKLISFEQLDKRKNADGTPVYYFEEIPFTGMTYDYNREVNVSLEHHLVDGLLTLKEGFRDGQKIEYAEFEEGRLHGLYLKLFGNGQKYVEHHYTDGKMHGPQYGWKRDEQFINWLKTAQDVSWKISVCTGSLLLGAAGMLKDKKATTHFDEYAALAPYCKEVIEEELVSDGQIITGGAVASSLDLGLHMCERWVDVEAAQAIQKRMNYKT